MNRSYFNLIRGDCYPIRPEALSPGQPPQPPSQADRELPRKAPGGGVQSHPRIR